MTDRRTLLLDTAAELFTRYGYRKTSVEDITRAAGVSKGSMYLEFHTKEDLFDALVRHEFTLYLSAAASRIDADPEGGRLSRIYHHCIKEILQRDFLRALYTRDDHVLSGLVQRRGARRYRPRVLLGTEFIERMQNARLIRADTAADVLSHTLSVLMTGPLLAEPILHTEDSPTLSETFGALSSMIVDSLETPGGDVAAGKAAFTDLARALDAALSERPAE